MLEYFIHKFYLISHVTKFNSDVDLLSYWYLKVSIKCYEINLQVSATVSVATPLRACEPLQNSDTLQGRIVVVERGECMFVEKVSFFLYFITKLYCTYKSILLLALPHDFTVENLTVILSFCSENNFMLNIISN